MQVFLQISVCLCGATISPQNKLRCFPRAQAKFVSSFNWVLKRNVVSHDPTVAFVEEWCRKHGFRSEMPLPQIDAPTSLKKAFPKFLLNSVLVITILERFWKNIEDVYLGFWAPSLWKRQIFLENRRVSFLRDLLTGDPGGLQITPSCF